MFTLLQETTESPTWVPSAVGLDVRPPSNVMWEMNTLSDPLMPINVAGDVSDADLNTVLVFPTKETSDGTFMVEEKI